MVIYPTYFIKSLKDCKIFNLERILNNFEFTQCPGLTLHIHLRHGKTNKIKGDNKIYSCCEGSSYIIFTVHLQILTVENFILLTPLIMDCKYMTCETLVWEPMEFWILIGLWIGASFSLGLFFKNGLDSYSKNWLNPHCFQVFYFNCCCLPD